MIETHDEFVVRNGGSPVRLRDEYTWLLPSGAYYNDDGRVEAPVDQFQRLTARANYHRAFARRCRDDFDDLKSALLVNAGRVFRWPDEFYGPAPTERDELGRPCGKAALLKIKALADQHVTAIANLLTEIEQLPQVKEQLAREQSLAQSLADSDRQSQQQSSKRKFEIEAITL